MSFLSLQGISKTFKHGTTPIHALRDVHLCVEQGELMIIVGPSGCGKTTSLRLIAGLEPPDAGAIHLDGRDQSGVPPQQRDVAMVFQNYALYPHMSVYKNLAFPLRMRNVPRTEIARQVDATAALLGISHLLDRKPAELSGGEQQRVALGRAIVRQPRLFLLDEPLSNLDPSLRLQMRGEIKALQRRLGTTMLYVTHDQEEAMSLGDRVAVLRGGQVQQIGLPLEIYEQPANRFVAEFFGRPPMNILPAQLRGDLRGARLLVGESVVSIPQLADSGMHEASEVVAGIRPQYLSVESPEQEIANGRVYLANGTIDWVEHLGDTMTAHVTTGAGQRLRVNIASGTQLSAGCPVRIAFDPRKTVLFRNDQRAARIP